MKNTRFLFAKQVCYAANLKPSMLCGILCNFIYQLAPKLSVITFIVNKTQFQTLLFREKISSKMFKWIKVKSKTLSIWFKDKKYLNSNNQLFYSHLLNSITFYWAQRELYKIYISTSVTYFLNYLLLLQHAKCFNLCILSI